MSLRCVLDDLLLGAIRIQGYLAQQCHAADGK